MSSIALRRWKRDTDSSHLLDEKLLSLLSFSHVPVDALKGLANDREICSDGIGRWNVIHTSHGVAWLESKRDQHSIVVNATLEYLTATNEI